MCNIDHIDDFTGTPTPWKPQSGEVCMVWFDDGRVCWHKAATLSVDPYDETETCFAFSLIGDHDHKLIWSTQYMEYDPSRKPTLDTATAVLLGKFGTDRKPDVIEIIETLYDAGLLHE